MFHVIATAEEALKYAFYNVCKCKINNTFKIHTN